MDKQRYVLSKAGFISFQIFVNFGTQVYKTKHRIQHKAGITLSYIIKQKPLNMLVTRRKIWKTPT